MITQPMEKMVQDLIEGLRVNLPPERILILARTSAEMVSIAKFADGYLKRAEDFSRTCYEGDKKFLFCLAFPIQDGEEPAEVWIANLHEGTPDTLDYFRDNTDLTDHVAWPDERGQYVVIPYDTWRNAWADGDCFFRPSEILAALQYEVGRPTGWAPPGRRRSVWEHLRHNPFNIRTVNEVSVRRDTDQEGKEVNDMAAAKKNAPKPAAKKTTKTAAKKTAPKAKKSAK